MKDTRGGPKTRKLHDVLATSLYDFDRECIERVQQVRSHESELLQLTDLLIGALTYANRGLASSTAKTLRSSERSAMHSTAPTQQLKPPKRTGAASNARPTHGR